MNKKPKVGDISKAGKQLLEISPKDWMRLPPPCDNSSSPAPFKQLTGEQKQKYEASLDGVLALAIPKPKSAAEEQELVKKFLSGLEKLFTKENNWTFLQPLKLSVEYCARCQTCNDACHVYEASGKQEIYRPTYRSEVLRQLVKRYLHGHGQDKFSAWFAGNTVELNWATISRLAESAYRCNLCRRCAQTCPIGIDNALIAHELRKLFSQEMGIAARECHELGTVQQLRVGSSTGITPVALKNTIQFMEEDIEERTGKRIKIPLDKEGADILLIHNAGEFLSWPENPEAFAIIFEAAGLNWTLSSDLVGYDSVNYGVWYDDVQFSRIALRHAQAAKKLKVKKIVLGECGHAHKALTVIADRIFTGETRVPRESCLTVLEDIVFNGKLQLDPRRNNFPVSLHDPCNIVRLMGIVEPQRRILRKICLDFREMNPHGVENYCCGGGSGFAIMSSMNFGDWRMNISGRMKLKQTLEVFQDVIDPSIHKYLCAPCSNCKGQLRDTLNYYKIWEKCSILYGGLVELIVNAMVDTKKPFIEWEWH